MDIVRVEIENHFQLTMFRLCPYFLTPCLFLVTLSSPGTAQTSGSSEAHQDEITPTMFPHPDTPLSVRAQMNVVFQTNPSFHSPYSGDNSFRPYYQKATSEVMTLYMGLRVSRSIDVIADVESAGGDGLSQALGIAGFTNLDVVRNPSLGKMPYVARILVHYVHGFGDDTTDSETNVVSLRPELPSRRLEVWVGKFSAPDFFDANAVGSDSHLQFLNWVLDNNGAYDYAADTRGYTWGAIAAYSRENWTVRVGEMLMPTVANGMTLDWRIARAGSENLEYEYRYRLGKREGTVRLLGWMNRANMGSYASALRDSQNGNNVPDITAHPAGTRIKIGVGVNVEQRISREVTAYARVGWNDGRNESFAYTEVDRAVSGGISVAGIRWRRRLDRAGVAAASEWLSSVHRSYLEAGGRGFILGDGHLNYGAERVAELYYTAHLYRGVYAGPDMQYVVNPGYNRDRGPVLVGGLRLHVEF